MKRRDLIGAGTLSLIAQGLLSRRADAAGPGSMDVVKDFGAAGDGIADDTYPFMDAFGNMPAGGCALTVPSGVYRTNFAIPKGARVVGAGKHATILVPAILGTPVAQTVSAGGGGQEVAHLQMQSLDPSGVSLLIRGVEDFNLHDARFYGPASAHVVLDNNNVPGAYGHHIDTCEVDCATGTVGILMTNSAASPNSGITSSTIDRTHIISDFPIRYANFAAGHGSNQGRGNTLQAKTPGVGVGISFAANCNADIWQENYFENFADAMLLASGAGQIAPITVDPNYFENCLRKVTDNNANKRGTFNNYQSGLALGGRFASARLMQTPNGGLLLSWQTLALGSSANFIGLVMVVDRSHARSALFEVQGGLGQVALATPTSLSHFSTTKNTPNRVNVYWSSSNSQYEIQNGWGGAIGVETLENNVSV